MTSTRGFRRVRREEQQEISVPTPAVIGVIGDTHLLRGDARTRLAPVFDLFRRAKVDLILHTGDAGALAVLRDLEEIAPVAAVRGNADPVETLDALPDRVLIHTGRRNILLLHGHLGKTAITTARRAASGEIDLLVFGHSHQPLMDREGSTILFNPGSPTERRWNPHFGIGLITVTDERVAPELILFTDMAHLANVAI
ncbi:MAG: metallophosphoesterase family protein [Thermomicrobiales bacterium]|nr:metallophosphoesterase family protein [Thermomicrobiales bacterium]